MDSVPDPLLLRKNMVAPRIEPGPVNLQPRTLTTRPQRRSKPSPTTKILFLIQLRKQAYFDIRVQSATKYIYIPYTRKLFSSWRMIMKNIHVF
jgi:hypothetical protein